MRHLKTFESYSSFADKIYEHISMVFMGDENKKESIYKLNKIMKAKSLTELEKIDPTFDEVILPYGDESEDVILDDIKKNAKEFVDNIPDRFTDKSPNQYQANLKNMSKSYDREKNKAKAYSNWD
jgi:hypothetical protein